MKITSMEARRTCTSKSFSWRLNIVAAFQGMHLSPAKQLCVTTKKVWLPDRRTDRQTEAGQSDPYVPLCFAGDTKMRVKFSMYTVTLHKFLFSSLRAFANTRFVCQMHMLSLQWYVFVQVSCINTLITSYYGGATRKKYAIGTTIHV